MLALGVAGAGCQGLVLDPAQVIALELSAPPASLVVGDTVRLAARALNAQGDEVPGAAIRWAVVDTGLVGFTIDSVGGLVTAVEPGSGRVQARVENLRSDPVRITVTAPPAPATAGRVP
jgi:hypothetical protein